MSPTPEPAEAQRIHAAVLGCPDVVALSAGPFGEIASYLPGGRVTGVRTDDRRVEVHVVARYGTPLPEVAERIGRALDGLLAGRTLEIAVEDIVLPEAAHP